MANCRIDLPSVADLTLGSCEVACGPFQITDCEAALMQGLATEQINVISTPVGYFRMDRRGSKWDPVYNEPTNLRFLPPLSLQGRVQKPTKATEAGERGQTTTWDAMLWLSRELFPADTPPQEGDVVGFWNDVFTRSSAVRWEDVPRAAHYYDVVGVDTDGHIADTGNFVVFEITLKRRTEFTPERRLNELAAR